MGGGEPAQRRHRPQSGVPGGIGHHVLRHRIVVERDGERALREPDAGPLPRDTQLAVDAPVPEPDIAGTVQLALEAQSGEDATELRLLVPCPGGVGQHHRGAELHPWQVALGPVRLDVEVVPPALVHCDQFLPGRGARKMIV